MKNDWRSRANCAGTNPALFYPEALEDGGTQQAAADLYVEARKVCAGCEVRAECLELGMTEKLGIFGGLVPKERRALRSERHSMSAAV